MCFMVQSESRSVQNGHFCHACGSDCAFRSYAEKHHAPITSPATIPSPRRPGQEQPVSGSSSSELLVKGGKQETNFSSSRADFVNFMIHFTSVPYVNDRFTDFYLLPDVPVRQTYDIWCVYSTMIDVICRYDIVETEEYYEILPEMHSAAERIVLNF